MLGWIKASWPRALVLGAIILILIWLAAVGFGYEPYLCPAYDVAGKDACTYPSKASFPLYLFGSFVAENDEFFVAFGTIVIATFTFTLWWSTDKLWQDAKAQSEINRKGVEAARRSAIAAIKGSKASADLAKAAEAANALANAALVQSGNQGKKQIRAYLSVMGVEWLSKPPGTAKPKVRMKYINAGDSPALDVMTEQSIGLIRGGLQTVANLPPVLQMANGTKSVCARGQIKELVTDATTPIRSEDWSLVASGHAIFFIRGWIKYRDVFGELQTTEYCLHVDHKTLAIGNEFTWSPTGNIMT